MRLWQTKRLRCSAALPRATVLPFLLPLDEAQELVHRREQPVIVTQDFSRVIEADFCSIQQAMCFRETINGFRRKIIALQSHNVYTTRTCWMTFAKHKRWNVVDHARQTSNKRIAPNR